MADRYEMVHAAHLRVRVAEAGYDFGHGDVFNTPALVLGDPGGTALVVVGTRQELAAALAEIGEELTGPVPDPEPVRTDVVVDRDPDNGTTVTVWRAGEDVTDDPETTVVVIDPGVGYTREEWDDDSDLEGLSPQAHAEARSLKDGYLDSEYITG